VWILVLVCAGPRDTSGFAMDDGEDDVYDAGGMDTYDQEIGLQVTLTTRCGCHPCQPSPGPSP
jgi:hypothetical protein